MLIFGEDLKPLIIDNADDPLVSDFVWTLDLVDKDFIFNHMMFLDEHFETGIGFSIGGQYVEIPDSWYILITEPINGELDLIKIKDIKGRHFDAFIYSHTSVIPKTAPMLMESSRVFKKFCSPILGKSLMLVHPISEDCGIVITPHNAYKKIKDLYVMDLYE